MVNDLMGDAMAFAINLNPLKFRIPVVGNLYDFIHVVDLR